MIGEHAQPAARHIYDRPYVLLTIAVLCWAGNFVLGRAVSGAVPPVGLAFWRWLGGALVIAGFALPHLRRDWPVVRAQIGIVLLLSLLGIAIFNTLIYTGLHFTTAINALLMQSAQPVVIIIFSFLLFRDTVKPRQMVAVAISLCGVVTIIARGDMAVLRALSLNVGDMIVLAAVFSYAAYTTLLRRRPRIHPLSFLFVTFSIGAAMLLPLYLWEGLSGQPMQLNMVTLGAVGYVVLFPAILAYLCYNRGVELLGANRAGHFFHLQPVFGTALAMAFLGEQFQLFHAVGIALILGGIALATIARSQ
ncbi:DMT family transporter [Chloroflexales bacterium ZM16-3]|nr:DMT family transporter [Chloroflexales bacterium ZM16-3]